MCWIAVLFRVNPRFPLVVAANREESRQRPTRAPFRWPGEPAVWAGRDEAEGGTWLGVNEAGLLAAVTNRPDTESEASRRSRGLLCLDCLRRRSPAAARAFVDDELTRRRYNAFNLLCASPDEGWVASGPGDIRALAPGVHVLSNFGDLDDDRLPVVGEAPHGGQPWRGSRPAPARLRPVPLAPLAPFGGAAETPPPVNREVRKRVEALPLDTPDLTALLHGLGRVCAATDGAVPLCRPSGDYGTVSSSVIAIDRDGQLAAYWHAPGPPCERAFAPVAIAAKA